jgi:transcriptional regulator with XRE-family HTH domain
MDLKTYREQKGLTLEQVGAELGVGKSTVQRIENRITQPKRKLASRIVAWSEHQVTIAELYAEPGTQSQGQAA